MKYILILPMMAITLAVSGQNINTTKGVMKKKKTASCTPNCTDGCGSTNALTCKLTSPEILERKATVIASLKNQVLEKKELSNGYTYKFKGDDNVLTELTEFIKTERLCCDFFDFGIRIAGDASTTWLSITGPEGTKTFIDTELGL
ncbi:MULTISPECIES: hypothetical protein [Olivibacter]|jgi:hypothetical protein|uniref:Uncharacterized protein n=1 Tax=Olivibacter jilunii TaxID=985016 RepID=A0ABW6B7L5_9SPHI|nr:hypothetical protein [Pseudosphingobacterium sp.]